MYELYIEQNEDGINAYLYYYDKESEQFITIVTLSNIDSITIDKKVPTEVKE